MKAVVRKIAGKWYVTVCCEVEAEERPDTGVLAGVDMNVRQVAVVDTTGEAEIRKIAGKWYVTVCSRTRSRLRSVPTPGSEHRRAWT